MRHSALFLLLLVSLLAVNQNVIAQSNGPQSQQFENEVTDSIYSKILGESRHYWVKFPDNYSPDNKEKYAVIYLLDGFSLKSTLEAVYDNYWGHYLPHMILVGVSNRTNRTRDLTTSQISTRRGSAMNSQTGGADNFTKFIEHELIPLIDSRYPTLPYRTLIGHSYAGLFTINMLVNHGHLFQNYIAIDPSLDWDDQKLLKQAKEKFKTEDYTGKSLFVSLAAEQLHMHNESITINNIMNDTTEFTLFARSIIDFSNFATTQNQNGLNFVWEVYPEDLHGTVPLPSIRDGLVSLFKWYQFKSPQKFNNPETSIEELVALLKEQEQIYTAHFGVPTAPMIDEMLNGYGYMFMQMEQPKKAFMFFELNIKHNPESANAYDSMAEYYESINDKENALKHLNKAFQISGDNYYKERIQSLTKQ